MPPYELVSFDDGFRFYTQSPAEARFQYEEMFEHGCYARVTLPARPFVIDAGANVGLFSLYVKQRNPDAEILAFEPMPESLGALRMNLELHGLEGVTVENCALGSAAESDVPFTYYPVIPANSTRHPGEKELQKKVLTPTLGHAFTTMMHEGTEVRVPVERLSRFLDDRDHVDLLKVDVEGAELDVLLGLDPDDWRKIDQVVLEVQDMEGRLDGIASLLRDHGLPPVVEPAPLMPEELLTYVVHATRP
ncbi:FkbM family methyltransferase [Streptomyces tagetis]|uniref:FkbM family methyltransferase n=1 Tax=Streptomyces tagetis TaxID=2820809 RepID=A0A941AYS6_9ACTN|nr:FkbM family methyltransferase [Streptomyces sp. RG38]MBQ0825400.1 FkbM family methyltransferase [Streptomyces sp. RG38]